MTDCAWGQGECIPNCPSCKRMDELLSERVAGFKEGIQAARDAVAALDHYRVLECDPGLMHGKRDDPDPWSQGYLVYSDDALAAIDALVEDGAE